MRLLQAVDHPYLVVHSASAPGAAEAQKKLQEEEAEGLLQGTCGVCHDHLEDPVMSSCDHVFCRACMMEYMEGAQGQAKCPSCEKPLSVDLSGSAAVSLSVQAFLFLFLFARLELVLLAAIDKQSRLSFTNSGSSEMQGGQLT